MPVPVVLVCGVQEEAMLTAGMSLQLGLPDAVTVRHTIDAGRRVLTRVVGDAGGVIERAEIDLAHACVPCAVREDIVPTLHRLADDARWSAIVACLPVAAAPDQVCRVLARTPQPRTVRVSAVVAALDGAGVAADLLGDDLLDERGLATSREDRRGVGEVACAMVEHADLVCLSTAPGPDELALLGALARRDTPVLSDPSLLDAAALAAGVHDPHESEAWTSAVRRRDLPPLPGDGAWRLDLVSERPLHPLRFRDEVPALGAGPRRSRGCFWLPTRPDLACAWSGAGGQVSVGPHGRWTRTTPLTRITVVGLAGDDGADAIAAAFERCLLTDGELARRGHDWLEAWDGMEAWLGPIERTA